MYWVEAQSTVVIALMLLLFCYAIAGTIFTLAAILSRRKIAKDFKAVVPITLTPLGVILGLLVAFLAYRVWTNLDQATGYLGKEASSLREAVLLADALPPDVRAQVRQAIQHHIDIVERNEWPAMASGQATLQSIAVGLSEAMIALLSFSPTQPSQQLAQQRTLMAIEHALEARRDRVRLSQVEIAPIQWLAIIVLAVLILLTIAMIHIDNLVAAGTALFIFSTAFGVCLVLLMVYDRPFGQGGFTLSPTLLRDVVPK